MKKKNIVICFSITLIAATYLGWANLDRNDAPVPFKESTSAQSVESQPESQSNPESKPTPTKPEYEIKPVSEANTQHTPLFYDVGIFGPDDLRREYISGEMILKVPRLNFEGPVYSDIKDITPGSLSYLGASVDALANGVTLFGAAQIPTDSNGNVSIAGHRDIYGMEFYDIDKITEGDYMFLEFRGKEYVYLFEDSFVTEDTDWNPIKTKDYGCITLQSCTPINVASHRIFVVGRLVEIRELRPQSTSLDTGLS